MKLISSVSFLFLAAIAVPAAEQMRPADFQFEEADKRLVNRIEFPDVSGKVSAMISCYSIIQKSGRMKDTGCYMKDNFDQQFAAAIIKAAKKASMTPAIINGEKSRIYMQYRVEFIADGDDRQMHLYPNPGYTENVEAYGPDHVAGQRAIGKEPWQDVCPQRAKYLVLVRAYLGEDGHPENPSVERLSGIMPTPDCQNAIKETILNSAYTPAMADGYPVPSTFVETFGN
jgi:hypothetical protein